MTKIKLYILHWLVQKYNELIKEINSILGDFDNERVVIVLMNISLEWTYLVISESYTVCVWFKNNYRI